MTNNGNGQISKRNERNKKNWIRDEWNIGSPLEKCALRYKISNTKRVHGNVQTIIKSVHFKQRIKNDIVNRTERQSIHRKKEENKNIHPKSSVISYHKTKLNIVGNGAKREEGKKYCIQLKQNQHLVQCRRLIFDDCNKRLPTIDVLTQIAVPGKSAWIQGSSSYQTKLTTLMSIIVP